MKLTVAKIDRLDFTNNPNSDKPSVTVWFTGCHFKCDGCYNKQLQDSSFGEKYEPHELYYIITDICDKFDIDDVVFLGGEPLDQDTFAIKWLANMLKTDGYRVWLYTGYDFESLPVESIKENCYVIKCGKYEKDKKIDGRFPVTTNQKIYKKHDGEWKELSTL